jgi:sec-independent protein translocase protein TatA
MFGSFGWMELLLILIIVLIIFGAGKLPQLGEGLGKAIKGFKKSMNEAEALEAEPAQRRTDQPEQGNQIASPPSVAQESSRQEQGSEAAIESRAQESSKQGQRASG